MVGGIALLQGRLGHQVLGQLLILDATELEIAGATAALAATAGQRDVVAQVLVRTAAPALAAHALIRKEERRLARLALATTEAGSRARERAQALEAWELDLAKERATLQRLAEQLKARAGAARAREATLARQRAGALESTAAALASERARQQRLAAQLKARAGAVRAREATVVRQLSVLRRVAHPVAHEAPQCPLLAVPPAHPVHPVHPTVGVRPRAVAHQAVHRELSVPPPAVAAAPSIPAGKAPALPAKPTRADPPAVPQPAARAGSARRAPEPAANPGAKGAKAVPEKLAGKRRRGRRTS
jgi:hypothetical protein